MNPFVVAVIATRNRPREMAQLLQSLEKVRYLGAVVVTDNGNDSKICDIVKNSQLKTCYLTPGKNLGCGGGLALAEKTALEKFGDCCTHLWILDDDALVPPDVLEILINEMERESADAACPMITTGDGHIGWPPGLLDRNKFIAVLQLKTPAEFVAKCGSEPIPFSWSTGISLLVTRRAVDKVGLHSDAFWMRGEDLDFSLRVTYRRKGIFVPTVSVQHLPPTANGTDKFEMLRHAVMLQNIVYLSFYHPHARRILRNVPGNYLRFLRTWGISNSIEMIRAFWRGAFLAQPGGKGGKQSFRARFDKLLSAK